MASERRQHERVRLPTPLKYRVEGEPGAALHLGELLEIGGGGLRFAGDRPLEVGRRVEFEISLHNRAAPYRFTGQPVLVWARQSKAGICEYGIEFVQVTSTQQFEVEELVQFLAQGRGLGA